TPTTPRRRPTVVGAASPLSMAGLPGATPGDDRFGTSGGVRPAGFGKPNVATPGGGACRTGCGTTLIWRTCANSEDEASTAAQASTSAERWRVFMGCSSPHRCAAAAQLAGAKAVDRRGSTAPTGATS